MLSTVVVLVRRIGWKGCRQRQSAVTVVLSKCPQEGICKLSSPERCSSWLKKIMFQNPPENAHVRGRGHQRLAKYLGKRPKAKPTLIAGSKRKRSENKVSERLWMGVLWKKWLPPLHRWLPLLHRNWVLRPLQAFAGREPELWRDSRRRAAPSTILW